MHDKLLPVPVSAELAKRENGEEVREDTPTVQPIEGQAKMTESANTDSRGGQNSSTNNVFSPDFVSMMDKHFKADFDNSYRWCPGAASRPRMVEIGMLWAQKETSKCGLNPNR